MVGFPSVERADSQPPPPDWVPPRKPSQHVFFGRLAPGEQVRLLCEADRRSARTLRSSSWPPLPTLTRKPSSTFSPPLPCASARKDCSEPALRKSSAISPSTSTGSTLAPTRWSRRLGRTTRTWKSRFTPAGGIFLLAAWIVGRP